MRSASPCRARRPWALKIPIQAFLSGAARCLRTTVRRMGSWRERRYGHQYPPVDGDLLRPRDRPDRGPLPRPGVVSRPHPGRGRADPGRDSRQSCGPFHGEAKIDDTQAHDLKDGRWYFNLQSKQYPPGRSEGPSFADKGLPACRLRADDPARDATGGNPGSEDPDLLGGNVAASPLARRRLRGGRRCGRRKRRSRARERRAVKGGVEYQDSPHGVDAARSSRPSFRLTNAVRSWPGQPSRLVQEYEA